MEVGLSKGARVAAFGALLVAAAANSRCTGGCYNHAGAVVVVPATACLMLWGGQSATDDVVCATPQLSGWNNCTQALTLPGPPLGGAAIVVGPGSRIAYPVGDTRAGVTVTVAGGTTTYTIDAMLDTTSLTITIPVR
jgi:hypothetical protein